MSKPNERYYAYLATQQTLLEADELANVVPDEPFLDFVAPSVRHESSRDIDEMYEELSIKVTPP